MKLIETGLWEEVVKTSPFSPVFLSNLKTGSNKKILWQCEKKHQWVASVIHRLKNKSGCPYCSGSRVLSGFNDLASTHPHVAAEWHPTKNGSLKPEEVKYGSKEKVWWIGKTCGHEWDAAILNRAAKNSGCPVCSNDRVLVGYNDLATTHPEIAKQWHPTKNGVVKTNGIVSGSSKISWWLGECGHFWKRTPANQVINSQCPYCDGGRQTFPGYNDLNTTHLELALEWHPTKNGSLKPTDLSFGSNLKVWWLCDEGHEWETQVNTRSKGANCVYCANQKTISGFNDYYSLNKKSKTFWDYEKNSLKPEQISLNSNQKVWWLCEEGHSWKTSPFEINRSVTESGCPKCYAKSFVSTPEKQIADYLKSCVSVETTVRNLIKGELDIYIPEKKIAIEFNGLYWHSEKFKNNKNYHYDKWVACKEKGIQLIQIWEDDWNRNPELIKNMLAQKLGISSEPKIYARNTSTKRISKEAAEAFLNQYHIQGFASGSYYVGLFNKTDIEKLVAVLVLKKEAGTNGATLNIIRYATSQNVLGGFTKLLKYAEQTYKPEKFITFSDNCVSNGGLYENNGFTADKELPPDYTYLVKNERAHKFGYRLKRFSNDPKLQYEPGLTERELAALNGLHRVWDAGKIRWVKNVAI